MSEAKQWEWLHKRFLLEMFSARLASAKRQYVEFVQGEESDIVTGFFGRKNPASIFGSQDFIKWVKAKYYQLKKGDEIPQSRQLAPTMVDIKEAVSRKYEITASSLQEGKRGQVNEPRNVVLYLAMKHSGLQLKEICKEFGFEKYSSVSSVVFQDNDASCSKQTDAKAG